MDEIKKMLDEGLQQIATAKDLKNLEDLRIAFLGKKGKLSSLMKAMKDIEENQRPLYGQQVNEVKKAFEKALIKQKDKFSKIAVLEKIAQEKIDITLPGQSLTTANIHPLTLVQQEIEDLFIGLGYQIVEGPEVELDQYNFERANIPKDHPARDMQDTFYIDPEVLLRTHTTAIQTRQLQIHAQNQELPIKVLCPGKVYRRDDDDATHSHQFVQVEGLLVDEQITMADLKGTLLFLAQKMFGEKRTIRLRPSYFQFTEPSVEVDVSCHICQGKGCSICKESGWIEILGAGMVHPHVLEMAGFDPHKLSGFAFGIGIERVAMLKYGIQDIRDFYTNDIRFLKAYKRFD